MKKLIYSLSILFLIFSCGQKTNNSKNEFEKKVSINTESYYTIISEKEEVIPKFDINKCNVVVEVTKKMTLYELKEIANDLKKTRKSYDKLWISFYLTDTNLDGAAWAIANFTPDLKVEITGTTESEEKEQKKNAENVDGKIIGKYYEEQFSSSAYTVYENNDNLLIKVTSKNGSSYEYEMKKKKADHGTRLDYKDGSHNGEYFILTTTDILEFYNAENNKFTIATKID